MTETTLKQLKLVSLVVAIGALAGPTALVIAAETSLVRMAAAAAILATIAVATVRGPKTAILLTFAYLPLLGLLRRLLIPVAGWTSWDALLIVAPVTSLFLVGRLFVVEKRPLVPDLLSKLVAGVLLLSLMESVNPQGGSLAAGLTGLLFAAAPLAWFFIGRELGDRRLVTSVMAMTAVMALAIGVYGLWQTSEGLPSWDATWQNLTGYTALDVGGSIRAFGSFSSSAEYGTFLGMGFVTVVAAVLRGRLIGLLALPVLGYAIFLESARGVVVLVLLAVFVMVGLRTGRGSVAVLTTSLAAAAAAGIIVTAGPQLIESAAHTGNPFLAHQAGGLLNPLDPRQSTLQTHQRLIVAGIVGSISHPLGQGLAAINPQGRRLAGASAGTEADFANEFVALGPFGGILYLAVVFCSLQQATRLALRAQQAVPLAVIGVMIVTLGQWLNGGYYAVAPALWLLVGWANQEWIHQKVSCQDRLPVAPKPTAPRWPSPAIGWASSMTKLGPSVTDT